MNALQELAVGEEAVGGWRSNLCFRDFSHGFCKQGNPTMHGYPGNGHNLNDGTLDAPGSLFECRQAISRYYPGKSFMWRQDSKHCEPVGDWPVTGATDGNCKWVTCNYNLNSDDIGGYRFQQ